MVDRHDKSYDVWPVVCRDSRGQDKRLPKLITNYYDNKLVANSQYIYKNMTLSQSVTKQI
jgi:hypothetical protein